MNRTFFIPHGVIESKLLGLLSVMKIGGLGGKLNGKLVTVRRGLSMAAEDSNAARAATTDDFAKMEDDGKGNMVRVKVAKRDAAGAIIYRRDKEGGILYEQRGDELVPMPEYDPSGVALTDPQAWLAEFNALLAEDLEVEIPALTAADILVIREKGTAQQADDMTDLSEESEFLKPKAEREAATAARRSKIPRLARGNRVEAPSAETAGNA